jgi:protein-L-isoaspartate(D-aspartate) O-methyltransferase
MLSAQACRISRTRLLRAQIAKHDCIFGRPTYAAHRTPRGPKFALRESSEYKMSLLETLRPFYAQLVTRLAGVPPTAPQLAEAFAAVRREQFLGAGPWQIVTPVGYLAAPDDPSFVYQDVAIALLPDRQINNGQPSLHARCLAALQIKQGEALVHVGAGTGYYTAVMSKLTGPNGSVVAYEVDQNLAARAAANLSQYPNVSVQNRSAVEAPLPPCHVIYVNAGATGPVAAWLDSLLPGGRLLFPMTSSQGAGGMLLITRSAGAQPGAPVSNSTFAAKFVSLAAFIHCLGARDEGLGAKLAEAFKTGAFLKVQSLRRDGQPDDTCWFAGQGWWLSTAPPVERSPL